jgi:hypothetical protein
MGCGCKKNKTQQTQQTQPKTNTTQVQESINKTVEKYYQKK